MLWGYSQTESADRNAVACPTGRSGTSSPKRETTRRCAGGNIEIQDTITMVMEYSVLPLLFSFRYALRQTDIEPHLSPIK